VLYIQLIHVSFLAQESEEQLFVVKLIQKSFKSESEIVWMLLQFIMIVYIVLLIVKSIAGISEANAGFSLGTMNTKFCDIDHKLTAQEITENEAAKLKNQVGAEVDFYSEQKESLTVLFKCTATFAVLTCIHFVSGIGTDIFLKNAPVKTAFLSNIPIVIGTCLSFLVLYVLFGVTVGTKKME